MHTQVTWFPRACFLDQSALGPSDRACPCAMESMDDEHMESMESRDDEHMECIFDEELSERDGVWMVEIEYKDDMFWPLPDQINVDVLTKFYHSEQQGVNTVEYSYEDRYTSAVHT